MGRVRKGDRRSRVGEGWVFPVTLLRSFPAPAQGETPGPGGHSVSKAGGAGTDLDVRRGDSTLTKFSPLGTRKTNRATPQNVKGKNDNLWSP